MLRVLLKSKLHNATITGASVEYVGSITIPRDLMEAADLWEGEKVLVASSSTGERLETYVIPGPSGSGRFEMNGAAALRIREGERVIIMGFGLSEQPMVPKVFFLDKDNRIIG